MVLCRDGLLHERLVEEHAVDLDVVVLLDEGVPARVVAVENRVSGQFDALAFEDGVNRRPVLDVELHFQVVDDVGLSQFGVIDGFLQREALRVKRDQTVAKRPFLHRILVKGNTDIG